MTRSVLSMVATRLVVGCLVVLSVLPWCLVDAAHAASDDPAPQDLEALHVDVPAIVPGAALEDRQVLSGGDISSQATPIGEITRSRFVAGTGWVYRVDDEQVAVVLMELRHAKAAAAIAEAQGTARSGVAPDSWEGVVRTREGVEISYAGTVGRLMVGVLYVGTSSAAAEADAVAQRVYLAQRATLPQLPDLSDDAATAISRRFGYAWGAGSFAVVLTGVLAGLVLGTATDRGSREWWRARRKDPPHPVHRIDLTARLSREGRFARGVPIVRGITLATALGVTAAWPSLRVWQGTAIVVAIVLAWTLAETWWRSRGSGSDLARGPVAVLVTGLGSVSGTVVVVAGVSMMTAAVAGVVARHPTATAVIVVPMVVFGMEIISWSRRPVRLAKRLLQPRVRAHLDHDARAPLLLLRSFQDDALEVRPPSASTGALDTFSGEARVRFEEVVAWTAWRYGPLRTFGQPGTRLQPLGAARDYHDDGTWQAAIRALADRAHALVLVVGRSPSLVWEITEVRLHERLARTVFVFPPVDDDETRRRVAMACAALDLDPRVLDPGPDRHLLALGFDEAGTPTVRVAAGRTGDAYALALDEALEAVTTYDLAGAPIAWARRPGGDPMADVAVFDPSGVTRRRTLISWISSIALSFVPL